MFDPNNPYNQPSQVNPYDTSNQYNPNYFKDQSLQPDFSDQHVRSPRRRGRKAIGCLILLLILAAVSSLCILITKIVSSVNLTGWLLLYNQGDNPLSSSLIWAVAIGTFVLGLLVFIVLRVLIASDKSTQKRSRARLGGELFILLFIVVMASSAAWQNINSDVGITSTGFTRANISINDGTALHLYNFAGGVTQVLCIGVDQHCQNVDGAPEQLEHGLTIQPGQIVDVVFENDATYQITSKTTPGMNLTITVNEDSGDD